MTHFELLVYPLTAEDVIVLLQLYIKEPLVASVYQPVNTEPVLVAVGTVRAVVPVALLYVAALLYDTYTGDVPDKVPLFVVASNVIVRFINPMTTPVDMVPSLDVNVPSLAVILTL